MSGPFYGRRLSCMFRSPAISPAPTSVRVNLSSALDYWLIGCMEMLPMPPLAISSTRLLDGQTHRRGCTQPQIPDGCGVAVFDQAVGLAALLAQCEGGGLAIQ